MVRLGSRLRGPPGWYLSLVNTLFGNGARYWKIDQIHDIREKLFWKWRITCYNPTSSGRILGRILRLLVKAKFSRKVLGRERSPPTYYFPYQNSTRYSENCSQIKGTILHRKVHGRDLMALHPDPGTSQCSQPLAPCKNREAKGITSM